eukprot:1129591-Pyramimonas_sp.AAC.2
MSPKALLAGSRTPRKARQTPRRRERSRRVSSLTALLSDCPLTVLAGDPRCRDGCERDSRPRHGRDHRWLRVAVDHRVPLLEREFGPPPAGGPLGGVPPRAKGGVPRHLHRPHPGSVRPARGRPEAECARHPGH